MRSRSDVSATSFMTCWWRMTQGLTILILAVVSALALTPAFGRSDERTFHHLTRKLRSTPGVSQYYNVGLSAPKAGRERPRLLVENICPSVPEWRNLSTALTADGSEVNIIQGMFGWAYQWFYTVQCSPKAENRTCQWIDEKQAPRTACITSYNLVPAIVQVDDVVDENGQLKTTFDWRMIRIPGRCGCFRVRSSISDQSPAPFATKLSAFE